MINVIIQSLLNIKHSGMKNIVKILTILLIIVLTHSCLKLKAPALTTSEVTNIMGTSATCGGFILNDGGSEITAAGVCWGIYPNPTTSNSKTNERYIEKQFTSNITGLDGSMTYHVRAYAINSLGTGYGEDISFTTDMEYVEDIDGNLYIKFSIGGQSWLRENLKVSRYNDGTPISNITDNSNWAGSTDGAYCWYDNDAASNKDPYGALYNWDAVSTQKLCPAGWHVPTLIEWDALISYLDGEDKAGGKIKETGIEHWLSPNTGATNETGFTALPCGSRNKLGEYTDIGNSGTWWSSNEYDTNSSYIYSLSHNNSIIVRHLDSKHMGYSIRCMKDYHRL